MTHAELRSLLPAYAEGTLIAAEATAVRAHLATGCPECLRLVFARPVGLPRPTPLPVRGSRMRLVATVVAAGAGVAVGLVLGRGGNRPSDAVAAALAALEAEVAALRARTDVACSPGEGSPMASGPTGTADGAGTAGAAEPDRDAPGAVDVAPSDARSWLDDLLPGGGIRIEALRPVVPGGAARGMAVWSTVRGLVVVDAAALPVGPGTTYRVRVTLADGSTAWAGDLEPGSTGSLTVTIVLPPAGHRPVRVVDLVRDPAGDAVATARF